MSQHVCASLRIKLFNSTVLSVLLYGLSSLTLKPVHHSMLRGARTKMLRNMAGWRRLEGESWAVTMHRMRLRVEALQSTSSSPDVSEQLFSLKWRLAKRLFTNAACEKWAPSLVRLESAHQRSRGRPPLQWQDDLKKFFESSGENSFQAALRKPELEKKYVEHCMQKLISNS